VLVLELLVGFVFIANSINVLLIVGGHLDDLFSEELVDLPHLVMMHPKPLSSSVKFISGHAFLEVQLQTLLESRDSRCLILGPVKRNVAVISLGSRVPSATAQVKISLIDSSEASSRRVSGISFGVRSSHEARAMSGAHVSIDHSLRHHVKLFRHLNHLTRERILRFLALFNIRRSSR
jgi:hypothetical protein